MTTPQVWESFPKNYRAKEMRKLAHWIRIGESGSVVGLVGCGRSNLLGFLCHRPDALQLYLPPKTNPVKLIPVDLNDLPTDDLSTLYRLILRAFYWVQDNFSEQIQAKISTLYRENKATQDPFLSQSALHELLRTFQSEQTRVTLVLNRFDRFCQMATPRMLNTLRSLRDNFKDILCFIAGMRQEMIYLRDMRQEVIYLRDSKSMGDMYELLDSHICWVGPMNEDDARWVITTVTQTAPIPPTEEEIKKMLAISGHVPVLLKAVGLWWLNQTDKPLVEKWQSLLTAERNFDYRLERYWRGLTQEEQFALVAVRDSLEQLSKAKKRSSTPKKAPKKLDENHLATLPRLEDKGVCYQDGHNWQIKGDLLAAYIKLVGPSSKGKIYLNKKDDRIYQGVTRLKKLAPLEDKLLRCLIARPYKSNLYTDLITEVWSEDGVDDQGQKFVERTKDDLQHLVRSLRKKVEMIPSEPRYIINRPGNPEGGYQFYPEGRPE